MAKRIEPPGAIGGLMASVMGFIRRKREDSNREPQAPPTLRINGYNLVLLDCDGEVTCTREWAAGSAFDFRPQWGLWVFCEFTNQTKQEVEIAEYEIELVSEEGLVVERFGHAFADPVFIAPGETKVFSGQWRL